MADTALRDAERALLSSPSDPETYARWVAAHLRSGGRDPRRAPRAGDEIRDVHGRATPLGQERTMTTAQVLEHRVVSGHAR